MACNKGRPEKLRTWNEECMRDAHNAVKNGNMSISGASKAFNVPRMTLSDRVNNKVPLEATMGVKPALNAEDESALYSYIEYLANRGFPLTIPQILGFAWCIATERGKADVFSKNGPSRVWWKGFKERNPALGTRIPDPLDRGRATKSNVTALRDYFALLKDTLESNQLMSKPQCIYNCDEAALFLNKSAGQKVIVPVRFKHAHSLSVATNEHISVHCCVNAAGAALPPMIIFTNCLPGGAYHRQGPINASYAFSDTGFMDKRLYHQWFEKTFLPHAVKERPLLLIQDGATSHISAPLIRSAIANDVILLCLPPKTTHITQPLDVAVYRKMKMETAKTISSAKMVKSDLWISKKNVSGVFKLIFEKSFTMACITEGFRKCGIYPFDPNAVDKTLLLRSSTETDPHSIDLSVKESEGHSQDTETSFKSSIQSVSNLPALSVPQAIDNTDSAANYIATPLVDMSLQASPNDSYQLSKDDGPLPFFNELNLSVGENGILDISSEEPLEQGSVLVQECPPELAFSAVELGLTPRKKRKYEDAFLLDIDLPKDNMFQTWRSLKLQISATENRPCESSPAFKVERSSTPVSEKCDPAPVHPLVRAGLIPADLADVLVVPTSATFKSKTRKSATKARVLTSSEVQQEIEEKEKQRKENEDAKEKRKLEREKRKIEKEAADAKRREEMKIKKELREKIKAEKEKAKKERIKTKQSKMPKVENIVCDN